MNDVAIDLSDSSRNILDGQGVVDAGANATSSFSYTATSSDTVYLDISAGGSNPAGLSGDYQITVTAGGSGDTVLDTALTDAVVFDGGTYGNIDAVPTNGSFNTSLDHDWLAVTLIAGHDYVFTGMAVSDTLNDVAIDLRDSSRTILNGQGVVDAGPSFRSMFTYTATSSGTEYLDISAGGDNPASQTGQYFVDYADAGADTILDTASTNASLTIGGFPFAGRINGVPESGSFDTSLDHDWYAVSLVAGHTYTFSAQAAGGSFNDVAIDLSVCPESSGRIAEFSEHEAD